MTNIECLGTIRLHAQTFGLVKMGVGECAFNRKDRRGMHTELRRGSIQQHVSRQNQMIADLCVGFLCDFSALWSFITHNYWWIEPHYHSLEDSDLSRHTPSIYPQLRME
jgi:hypothetical protein